MANLLHGWFWLELATWFLARIGYTALCRMILFAQLLSVEVSVVFGLKLTSPTPTHTLHPRPPQDSSRPPFTYIHMRRHTKFRHTDVFLSYKYFDLPYVKTID